ncbi:MAG TPA: lipopolysaccharide biosynthesis protein [Steroidobacteraceae bacterium]|nr:lipopolysaccharide biosynthesis protein [Steroidobacteraceae bacterium]
MNALANQAAILTISRIANYGLVLLSPIVLVRLLSVDDFGRYREFLVFATLLQAFAAFSIADSLLYFVPANPRSPWRAVRRTAVLTLCTSGLVVALLYAGESLMRGRLVGGYLHALALYTFLFVNVDFWERLWLALGRPLAVFAYSSARLVARMIVVIATAAATRDVQMIILALIALEAVRVAGSCIVWWRQDRSREEPPLASGWREQLRYCIPGGTAVMLSSTSSNVVKIAVARMLGPAALAQFTIGTYPEPIITTVRGSISQVVLPEMVRRDRGATAESLAVWGRATVIGMVLLFPVVVLIARYAEPLVVTVFGPGYREAAFLMQLYMLAVVRACFDFAPPLRAINRNASLVNASLARLLLSVALLWVLVPSAGLAGALGAFLIAKYFEAFYLGWCVMRVYSLPVRELLPWGRIARTGAAALVAALVLHRVWTDVFGVAGVLVAGVVYLAAFAFMIRVLRVEEGFATFAWLRGRVFSVAARFGR